jgi:hypothetical protein
MKEASLVREVANYLSFREVWFYRANSGALRGASGKPVRFGAKGHPDFYARGKPGGRRGASSVVWIECKTKKGKLSQEQRDWEEKARKHGDIFIVARCLGDVIDVFEGRYR